MTTRGLFFVWICWALVACSVLPTSREQKPVPDQGEALYRRVEAQLREGHEEKALAEIEAPGAKASAGAWAEPLALLEAQALTNVGRYQEAETLLRGVRDRQAVNRPELATLAEWQLSFLAEARGELTQALTHLRGVRLRSADLPEDLRLAELPARFALLSYRVGDTEAAERAVAEAERGLKILTSGDRRLAEPGWLARLYYEMGRSVSPDLRGEDFPAVLRAQKISQRYLLLSIEANHPIWSPRALESFRTQLLELWNSIVLLTPPPELDVAAGERWRRESRFRRCAALLDVIDEAGLRRLQEGATANSFEKEAHDLLEVVRGRAENIVHSNAPTMPLTDESLRLNSLRRGDSARPVKSVTPPDPATDPN